MVTLRVIAASGHLRFMPRYYFNLYDDEVTIDQEGREFADEHGARAHAVREARVLAADSVSRGHFTASDRIEIVDEDRKVVGNVRFDEAVEIRP